MKLVTLLVSASALASSTALGGGLFDDITLNP